MSSLFKLGSRKSGDAGSGGVRNKYDDKITEYVLTNDAAKLKPVLEKKKFSSLQAVDGDGRTPLYTACMNGFADVAELLIAADTDASFADSDGRTALHVAAVHGHSKCITTLLRKGVPKDTVDSKRQTALHLAACNGQMDALQVLLANQCDTEVRDKDGNTPLLCAIESNQRQPAIALMNASANVNAVNRMSRSSLMYACEQGSADVVQMLLARGADTTKVDTGGKTARSYAAAHTHVQSILPASAPMGKTTSRQDSGGNSEPVSPTALRRMSLSKKFGAGSAGDQEKIKELTAKVSSLEADLEKERQAHQQAKDQINVLKLQLAAFADSTPQGKDEDDDDDDLFGSDDELDLGEDNAEKAEKEKEKENKRLASEQEIAKLSAQIAAMEISQQELQAAKEAAESRDLGAEAQKEIAALKDEVSELEDRLKTMGGGMPVVPIAVLESLKESHKKQLDELRAAANGNGAGPSSDEDVAELKKEHAQQIAVYRDQLLRAVQGQLSDDVSEGLAQIIALEESPA